MNRACPEHVRELQLVAEQSCDVCRLEALYLELRAALKACRREMESKTRGQRWKATCDAADELLERTAGR